MGAVTVEVTPYREAPWAPPMEKARWAWRVSGADGTEVTGASCSPKAEVVRMANKMGQRIERLQRAGDVPPKWREFRVSSKGAVG